MRRWDVGETLTVLFDENSSEPVSPVFVVRPGDAVVLSAYGLRKRADQVYGSGCVTTEHLDHRMRHVVSAPELVVLERLRYDASLMPHGTICCGGAPVIGELTHSACVSQSGLWTLSASQNVGVLALPGTYRLRVNEACALGCFYVDAMSVPAERIAQVPDDLWFGKVTAPGATVTRESYA